jgi:LPS-assembly protein
MTRQPAPWWSMSKLWLLLALALSLHAVEMVYDDENTTMQDAALEQIDRLSTNRFASTLNTRRSNGLMTLGKKLQLFATDIDSKANIVHARGDVLVLHEDQYLSANEALYDRNSSVLELNGNVVMMKGRDYFVLGEKSVMNMAKKERQISPFYLSEKKSRVWLSCKDAHALDTNLTLGSGSMSGCNPNDPLWTVDFSSADYNTDTMWLDIYNARLNVFDVPILYTPYFGYSLDTTRRTGLLPPTIGFSSSEGFYYQQPIYIAEDDQWDIELLPQVRTNRGQGLYGTFRFVDSKYSKGSFRTGVFQEKSEYAQEYLLQNDSHYGFNLEYENRAWLKSWFGSDLKGQSGLYSDINWMNDIDYHNLSTYQDETQYATTNQLFSRVNAFYNNESQYLGAYFKYYRDLESDQNDETIQDLPTAHYHKYLETFWDDHLMTNGDLSIKHLWRPTGKRALKSNLDIPVTLQTSLFDDYLDISYNAALNGRHITFNGDPDTQNLNTEYEAGRYYRDVHTIEAGTYLTKPYSEYSHAITMKASHTKAGNEHRSGYYEAIEQTCDPASSLYDPLDDRCSYYNISEIQEVTQLELSNYLFDVKGNERLHHRLSQAVRHERDQKLGELENEIVWRPIVKLTLRSDTFWDHQRDYLSKQSTSLNYADDTVSLSIGHLFEDRLRRSQSVDSDYITSNVAYRYNKHYKYFASYNYDYENKIRKQAQVGFLYQQRCWDFGLRYVENNRPILQQGGQANNVYEKFIFATVVLKPMGGSEFDYKLSNDAQ